MLGRTFRSSVSLFIWRLVTGGGRDFCAGANGVAAQKLLALGEFRVLPEVSRRRATQLLSCRAFTFCPNCGGPHFWRQNPIVWSSRGGKYRVNFRARRAPKATKLARLLFRFACDA
jgi:hypothetical protein